MMAAYFLVPVTRVLFIIIMMMEINRRISPLPVAIIGIHHTATTSWGVLLLLIYISRIDGIKL